MTYIIPDEPIWDDVPATSSSSDPYPSKPFSFSVFNKSSTVHNWCSEIYGATSEGHWDTTPMCFTQVSSSIVDFISYTNSCVMCEIEEVINTPVCTVSPSIESLVKTNLVTHCPTSTSIIDAILNNGFCDKTALSSIGFDFTSMGCSSVTYPSRGPNKVATSCGNYIGWINQTSFNYIYYDMPEMCRDIVYASTSVASAGCRNEIIGINTLQDVFGTNYTVVISCHVPPNLVFAVPYWTGRSLSKIELDVQGQLQEMNCKISTVGTAIVSKICSMIGDATVPLLQYGRFNSMIYMGVIPESGRMSS